MKANHKIDAIRIIRNLGVIVQPAKSENGTMINRVSVDISLFAAKELVESIMDLNSTINPLALKEAQDTIAYLNNKNDVLSKALQAAEDNYYRLEDKVRSILK